jgi:hypothetical protein
MPFSSADGASSVPIRDDLAAPLKSLLVATFRAGVLPVGDVLPHLHATDGFFAAVLERTA